MTSVQESYGKKVMEPRLGIKKTGLNSISTINDLKQLSYFKVCSLLFKLYAKGVRVYDGQDLFLSSQKVLFLFMYY